MKFRATAILCSILFFLSANLYAETAGKKKPQTEMEKVSYVIGTQIGSDIKRQPVEYDVDFLVQGILEAFKNKKLAFNPGEMQQIMNDFRTSMRKKMEEKKKTAGAGNLKEGKEFLAQNGKRKEVTTLKSGLQYEVLRQGKGAKPNVNDRVKTHYRGTLLNGTEFDSSYARNQPATFPLKGVIKGWTEALQLMNVGSKWKLYIPPELAYGGRGSGKIGPNSTLIFEVELLEIVK